MMVVWNYVCFVYFEIEYLKFNRILERMEKIICTRTENKARFFDVLVDK